MNIQKTPTDNVVDELLRKEKEFFFLNNVLIIKLCYV